MSKWDLSNWTAASTGKPVTLFQALGFTKTPTFPPFTAVLPGPAGTAAAAQQAAAAAAATTSGGGGGNVNPTTGGATGVLGIYKALISVGASSLQAIGIMANMMNESNFNPEAVGDGGTSFGLVQNHGDYSYLVTGNPAKDMLAQIKNLVQSGGLSAASGSTAEQIAGNFAANYERCVGCQPGGAQYNSRVGNVAAVKKLLGMLWQIRQ
jgi:hypothetical protein